MTEPTSTAEPAAAHALPSTLALTSPAEATSRADISSGGEPGTTLDTRAPRRPVERDASGLLPLPAPARLMRVLEALAQALPGELATLLAAPRFAAGAAALARLIHPARRDAAVRSLHPVEIEWLADELLARWARLASPHLPPAVGLLVPDDVQLTDRPRRVVLQLCAAGILPDWSARWHGAEPAPDAASATLTLPPVTGATLAPITVRVHVHARGEDGARHALVAEATILPGSG